MDPSYSVKPATPNVVKNLIITTVVAFVLVLAANEFTGFNAVAHFGLFPFTSQYFKPWQFVTHIFLHSTNDIFHLFFNMLGLWMFGSALEQLWGPKKFLFYYFATGIGAGVIYSVATHFQLQPVFNEAQAYLQNPTYDAFDAFISANMRGSYDNTQVNEFLKAWYYDRSNPAYISASGELVQQVLIQRVNNPAVGASGAIYGLLLAFGISFPNAMIMMLIPPIPMKAKYFVFVFGAIELGLGLRNSLDDNVAHFAHLGGMVFGLILVFIYKKQDRRKNVNRI